MTKASDSAPSCGADELAEYAAGRLTPARAAAWEGHLAGCARCRFELADLEALRTRLATSAPSLPGGLTSALLALGAEDDLTGRAATGHAGNPPGPAPAVPVPATGQRAGAHPMPPLLLVAPTSPPAHRSVLRSGVIAAAAAGASVAAAWSLGVVATRQGPPTTVGTVVGTPAATSMARVTITTVGWSPASEAGPEWPCWDDKAQSAP